MLIAPASQSSLAVRRVWGMRTVFLKCTVHTSSKACPVHIALKTIVRFPVDVAAREVIVGFLSTTCLAFLVALAVLFLDRYELVINFFRRHTSARTPHHHDTANCPYWRSPPFWSRVLSRNLLALADTQLLTGLAVQFVALLQHCTLSVYHFQIVTELAFLTTVTHLLTVVTLRDYFVRYRWINLPRIFFMLGNLALLGYTSYISYTYEMAGLDKTTSLACFFQSARPPFKSAFGGKWAALLIGAIGGHVAVILAMYVLADDNESDTNRDHRNTRWAWAKWLGMMFRTWLLTPTYAIYGVWMAGKGLKNTKALGNPGIHIDGDENKWGFGQFLPVLLLALPVFAGWETFWEQKDEDAENRFGRHHNYSRDSRPSRNTLDMFEIQEPLRQDRGIENKVSCNTSIEEMTTESPGVRLSPLHRQSRDRLTAISTLEHVASPLLGSHSAVQGSRSSSRSEEHLK
ncbi:hypothetical protein P280DRAFT_196062 [Massarina eburnea CBS 473.64]|uniref:Uncharacterized protein n=1 Tax=Massarina eburnea CBS 473.64 TaxID=1395130 RepID=A0A6A6RJ27_9PLEO|nr:hypothetical protein P280DRAFT_196062 [Massarina eburnea CBS 473.64]